MLMATRKHIFLGLLSAVAVLMGVYFISIGFSSPEDVQRAQVEPVPVNFDGERAYEHVLRQISFGPRTPNSEAHSQTRAYIREVLEADGWYVEEQFFDVNGYPGYNIIAKRSQDSVGRILLGAHYDSRIRADNDPDVNKRNQAVPGANDGASGVAALLELGRTIPEDVGDVWLVFFDQEDNGRLPTWEWIQGSRAFIGGYALNKDAVEAVVILDMIGDADVNIYLEKNSTPEIRAEIWLQAKSLGYDEFFINEEKFAILDDHTPFLEAGIPAVDVIDFDYPYWHTTEDTADKVSPESLQIVGRTMLAWLKMHP